MPVSRRIVFQGLGALGVAAALAGCGGGNDSSAGADGGQSGRSGAGGAGGADPTGTTSSGGGTSKGAPSGGAAALATTDEVPVGGGIILTDQRIVITQPAQGEFKAFSAVCTHEGNTVTSVADGTISCAFHGSTFDAETGAPTGGPAPVALAEVAIKVTGDKIVAA